MVVPLAGTERYIRRCSSCGRNYLDDASKRESRLTDREAAFRLMELLFITNAKIRGYIWSFVYEFIDFL